jgi:hypothetical protein
MNIPGNNLNDLLNRLTNINQFCTCFMQLKHMKCVCSKCMNNVGCDIKSIISRRNIILVLNLAPCNFCYNSQSYFSQLPNMTFWICNSSKLLRSMSSIWVHT